MRVALVVAALLLAAPTTAWAHVTVLPPVSRPGETAELTFRTPNERDDSQTVRLEVFLPAGTGAEVEPTDGWTATRIPDGGVRWDAQPGHELRAGRTEDFKVRLGPLPDAPRIVFRALQFYADAQVVRWIQAPTPDAERPAAVLDLGGGPVGTDASADDRSGGAPWAPIVAAALVALVVALVVALRRVRVG